jgi:hypothetical protein
MDRFKADVIDVAVKEINELSDVNISYKQVKKGRSVIALQFNYAIKQNRKKYDPEVDADTHSLSKLKSKNKPQASQPEKSEMAGCINIDIFQFNDKDKQLAQNALAKVPEATQRIILDMFKSALANRDIKSPLRYLNSLVSKSLSGDLDITAFENVPTPSNHFEKQTRRADKIKQTFAKHTDEIKAKLADDGHVFIQGEGTITQSEFEALGLIDKAPRTGTKSISLSDLMDKAQVQENLRKEKEITQKKVKRENDAKQPKNVADIPVSPMSEKEVAARQKILELEAELIAAGEFTGVNAMAIGEDEIAEMAKLDTVMQHFKQIAEKQK